VNQWLSLVLLRDKNNKEGRKGLSNYFKEIKQSKIITKSAIKEEMQEEGSGE
jgi:hypothetical protein